MSNGDSILTFTYNDKQQLTQVSDTLGKIVKIEYSPNSHTPIVEQVTDNTNTNRPNRQQEMNVTYIFESPFWQSLPSKYDEKIKILIQKLQKEYGQTKWEKTKAKIKLAKENFLSTIHDKYLAMTYRYILERILSAQ